MRTSAVLFLAATGLFAFGCGGKQGGAPGAPSSTTSTTDGGVSDDVASRKILHRKDIAEMPGKEAIVVLATIPPHSAIGRHTHPGQEVAYVLSGSIQLINDGEDPRTISAGETLSSSPNKAHDVKNVGNEPAKIVDFMVVEKGQPLSSPAK